MQDAPLAEAPEQLPEVFEPHEVEPGVWRVPAPLPFGAHAVNLYLLRGGDPAEGWLLVDCPLGSTRSTATLQTALDRIGIAASDIRAIALTHAHPDHLGAVGYWQRLTGAPVYLLAPEAQTIPTLWGDVTNTAELNAARSFAAHGMPADEAQGLVTRAVQLRRLLDLPAHLAPLAHGQRVRLAGAIYHAIWTPGHADGHLCLLRDDGILIAGDVALPALHPTVGRYPWTRPDPLADQLASLAALADLPARLVLPGHGEPYTDLRRRAHELSGVYTRELVVIARMLADASSEGLSAYALATELYAARWRQIDSRLVAMAEAVARLEHLCVIGRAERTTGDDGAIVYRRAHEGEDEQERFNTEETE